MSSPARWKVAGGERNGDRDRNGQRSQDGHRQHRDAGEPRSQDHGQQGAEPKPTDSISCHSLVSPAGRCMPHQQPITPPTPDHGHRAARAGKGPDHGSDGFADSTVSNGSQGPIAHQRGNHRIGLLVSCLLFRKNEQGRNIGVSSQGLLVLRADQQLPQCIVPQGGNGLSGN
jgi:hypothetical protein